MLEVRLENGVIRLRQDVPGGWHRSAPQRWYEGKDYIFLVYLPDNRSGNWQHGEYGVYRGWGSPDRVYWWEVSIPSRNKFPDRNDKPWDVPLELTRVMEKVAQKRNANFEYRTIHEQWALYLRGEFNGGTAGDCTGSIHLTLCDLVPIEDRKAFVRALFRDIRDAVLPVTDEEYQEWEERTLHGEFGSARATRLRELALQRQQ